MGWIRLLTHLGVTIPGKRVVRWRIISNEAEPDPITTPAWITSAGTVDSSMIRATSARERRCGERSVSSSGWRPDRWTMRSMPASSAARTNASVVSRSSRSKSLESPIECTR